MTQLKRELGYNDIVLATLGYVIGAGIYAVISIASKYGKDLTWLAVVICGILAMCTGLSYAELSSIYNKNGGEYFFIKDAFNEPFAKFMSFIIIFIEILAITTVTFGLSNHLSTVIKLPSVLISFCILSIFSYVNYSGIRSSVDYNNVTTIIETLGLVVIGGMGLFNLGKKDVERAIKPLDDLNTKKMMNLLMATSVIFFSFTGFDFIIELSEETINPGVTIPNGMLTGITLSTILYFFVAVAAINSIGWRKLSTSLTPMADVADKLFGGYGFQALLIIAMISMSNTILMGHVGASRFIQKIATEFPLPFNLDYINDMTNTPSNAIMAVTLISFATLLLGNLENSVKFTNALTLFLFFLVNVCAILLRKKIPDVKRKFKMPLNFKNIPIPAVIGAVTSLILTFVIVTSNNI